MFTFCLASFLSCLQNSTDSVYQGLWSGIQRFQKSDATVLSLDVSVMTNKVRSENFVLLLPETDSLNMFADDCNIILQDTTLLTRMQAPILPKGSALAKPLADVWVDFLSGNRIIWSVGVAFEGFQDVRSTGPLTHMLF